MFDKTNIQTKLQPYVDRSRAYLLSLRDIRNVGILVFTIVVLLISWSGVKSIQTNYGLQKQISKLQQENDVQKLQDQNLQLQNQYYGTDQYLELTARENLGLAAPGETELLLPSSVALAHTVKQPKTLTSTSDIPKQSTATHNFEAWLDFFFHRTTLH